MSRLHIIQICPCYVDLNADNGGVSSPTRRISLGMAKQGHRITILCGNRREGKIQAPPQIIKAGLITEVVQKQHTHPLMGPVANMSQITFNKNEINVAHVHSCMSIFTESAMQWLWDHNIPYIFTPRGKLSPVIFNHHGLLKRFYWRLYAHKIINRARKIVLCAKNEAEIFSELGLSLDPLAIPNGFDPSDCDFPGTEMPIIDAPYILFIGRLDPKKQPLFLVEVFARSILKNTHKLVFVGPDGHDYLAILKMAVQQLGISERVIFYGSAWETEKWRLLKHAACLVLPSLSEGLPIVLCEACGAGIPSVYSDKCNFPELTTLNCGIEIKGFNHYDWQNAIEKLCMDKENTLKMKDSIALHRDTFSWNKICQQWESLYLEYAIPYKSNK